MKGFLQEYGIIMVVVSVVLGMLAFGKTGYAKSIQNAILGSADHIVETGDNITKSDKKEVHVTAGDMLDIEGTKYVVLEQKENNQALVMTASSIGKKVFQSIGRPDKQNGNTYENSEIDKYLENEWYNGLSSTIKAAIQQTNIKQASYKHIYSNDLSKDQYFEQETGPNGQVYNTINRHVFLPSVSEIGKAVDLKNSDKLKAFLTTGFIWTRDSYHNDTVYALTLSPFCGCSTHSLMHDNHDVRPAFVIDLSQIDYEVTGHVDYK